MTITEVSGGQGPGPMPMMAMMDSRSSSKEMASPSVEAGRQDISVTVNATFAVN